MLMELLRLYHPCADVLAALTQDATRDGSSVVASGASSSTSFEQSRHTKLLKSPEYASLKAKPKFLVFRQNGWVQEHTAASMHAPSA